MHRRRIIPSLLLIGTAVCCGAWAPMNYLTAYGSKADTVLPLTWAVLIVAISVILIMLVLVTAGAWLRGRSLPPLLISNLPVGHTSSGLSWIYIGVAITGAVLLGTVFWTMAVLANVYLPSTKPAFTILVTAHQWWWELEYEGKNPSQSFTTANEIHIPIGVPVRFLLRSADVIHSFWIPPLNGKTDTIPGQTNVTWMEASKPGTYAGQCTEYCGLQHANMAIYVIAQTPADFQAWWNHQLADQPEATTPAAIAALDTFTTRCGGCHTVRGTSAGGDVGPDLSHFLTRTTIAAGTLPNTRGNLSAWIADPQSIKPGAYMPTLGLSGPELVQIRSFLNTLK